MSGLYSVIGPKIEELHAREDATRAPRAQMYVNILSQSQPGTPQYDEAYEQLNKIYGRSKEAKAILGRVKQFTDQMPQRAASGQQALPAPGQAAPVSSQAPDRPNTGGWRPASPQEIEQSKVTQAAGPGMTLPPSPSSPSPSTAGAPPTSSPATEALTLPARHRGALSKVGHFLGAAGKNIAENTFGVGIDRRLRDARQAQSAAELGAQLTTPTAEQQKQRDFQEFSRQVDQMSDIDDKEKAKLKREGRYKILLGLNPDKALAQAKMTSVQLEMNSGETIAGLRDPEGNYFTLDHTPIEGNTIKREAAKPTSARATIIASDVTTLPQAVKLAAQGKKFLDEDDKEIDLTQIPPEMVLQAVELPGGKTRYRPRGINDKTVTVGGVTYAVNPMEVQQLGQGAGTELGPSRAGTSRLSPTTTTDPETGQPIQTPGITQPLAPGIPGRPAPATPGARALPAPAGETPAPAATRPKPLEQRTLPGVTTGQYNQFRQAIVPVREAATQVFGDPARPDLKPLIEYGDLADSKESRERLGDAVRLSLHGLEQASGGPSADARVGPVGVSTGGAGAWISNTLGIPAAVADQQTKMMQKAINALNPREREAFDAIMSSYSTIVGLRSLTKASAAQSSVRAIEREMPAIGLNTFSSQQFYDQMRRLAEVIQNGTKGIPPVMLGPALTTNVESIPARIDALSKKTSPSGKSSGKSSGSFDPDAYIDKILKGK